MRPHRHHGELRNMRVLRDEPRDATQAEARAEPVDEMRKLRRMIGLREAGLRRFAPFGDECREAQHVVAEARIDLVADDAEPVREQMADACCLAQRLARADLDAKNLAVGAEQRGLQQPRAFAAPLQQRAELSGELSMVPSTSRSSAIGSAKRCSVIAAGTGRRGAIGSSSRPSA